MCNVADDEALSTIDTFSIFAESQNKKSKIWKFSITLIQFLVKLGYLLQLPLTTGGLKNQSKSYVVSKLKKKTVFGTPLPVYAKNGLSKTFNFYNNSAQ